VSEVPDQPNRNPKFTWDKSVGVPKKYESVEEALAAEDEEDN
jgi:hypothetical protein